MILCDRLRPASVTESSTVLWLISRHLSYARQIGKEVVLQNVRNAHQQFCVQVVLSEYAIYIAPIARQMAGKPADTSFLTT